MGLRDQIEFYPPGVIIIRGPRGAATLIQELPAAVIADLTARGYCFLVLPEGARLETVPDEELEKALRDRQRARKPVIKVDRDGMN